jgi:uncharacterized flavoprotein (TIGR03862 family)
MADHPEVAVIGGGPAGLMAAETIAEAGARVTVYDWMPSVGRKFLMAGRGGLNLTHSEPFERVVTRYREGAERLQPALEAFPPEALRAWAEGLGEPTFVGSSGRVFPKSFKASPLLRAWLGRLGRLGVTFRPRCRFVAFAADGGLEFETPSGPETVRPAAAVFALGGASWPRLGTDGTWVEPFRAAGLAVEPLLPANAGVEIAWSDIFRERAAGEPLKRVALTAAGETVRGEALVTAEGLEGGAVYALTAAIRAALATGPVTLTVDLKPDLSAGALARALERTRSRDSLTNRLRKGAGLAPAAIGVLREGHGRDLPSDPAALAALIKAVPLTVTGARPLDRAISSAGGLAFAALDDRYAILGRPGCFAAGEMLDWEAPTGGYLLQAAFATGAAAGRGVIAHLGLRAEGPAGA